jgi:hypothetical protein
LAARRNQLGLIGLILVAHRFGKMRARQQRGPKTGNDVKSIEQIEAMIGELTTV